MIFLNQVLQDVTINKPSVYRVILRYNNPNPDTYIGEVSVDRIDGQGDAQSHQVSFYIIAVMKYYHRMSLIQALFLYFALTLFKHQCSVLFTFTVKLM